MHDNDGRKVTEYRRKKLFSFIVFSDLWQEQTMFERRNLHKKKIVGSGPVTCCTTQFSNSNLIENRT
jgi:hypothetical protein